MVEIWNKSKISKLSLNEKNQWFEVLNDKLEEDRNISLLDPLLKEKQQEIKNDYLTYIDSCAKATNFYKYYILTDNTRIISVCRINIYDNKFLLEGLQTHKNYLRRGFATKLINEMINDLKIDGITTIYSEARKWNDASNCLQRKLGFIQYGQDEVNILYKLNVEAYLKKQLFDCWASNYNQSVIKSEQQGTYPFAGYSEIKYQIIELISKRKSAKILDMGVGTGEITSPLYDLGYDITGVDISEKMIGLAKNGMPNATFIKKEFTDIISVLNSKFDFIIFNYSIHHLSYDEQIDLLINLNPFLEDSGTIIIGDVSSMIQDEMDLLEQKYSLIWDDDEYYPILKIYQKSNLIELYEIRYMQLNEVAGIYQFRKIGK